MKKVLACLCAGAFALALIGCGDGAAPKKPVEPGDVKKKVEEVAKCDKCSKTPCECKEGM